MKARRRRKLPEPPQPFEITALRNKLSLTKDQFGRLLSMAGNTLANYEKGAAPMHERYIHAFRRIQGVADHLLARRAKPDWNL